MSVDCNLVPRLFIVHDTTGADCKVERANKKCCYKMCKGCCVKHCVHFPDIDLCKEKGHAKSAQEARLGEDEKDDGMEAEEEDGMEADD